MKKFILLMTATAVLTVVLAACSGKQNEAEGNNSGSKAITAEDTDVVIEKSLFSEAAQFIPVTVDSRTMEIIAVKAPDGTLRTAFNTCQVCYDSGQGYYEQDGEALVCQNCGNRFKMSQISVEKGGCNPVGISDNMRTETDTEITIPLDLLKQAAPLFDNWKKS